MKRTVSAAAVVALAASGLIAGAAHAEDSPITYGNITGTEGKLTIHKFESGSLQNPDSVTAAKPDAQGQGVNGVTFKVHPIAVDLKTNEGWTAINALTNIPATSCNDNGDAVFAQLGNNFSAKVGEASQERKTAAGGVATFENLPVGAYLVCEKKLGEGETATNVAGNAVTVVKRSAPFVVTLPRPQKNGDGDNTGWIYDVHAYPKNTVSESPKKAVSVADDKWLIGTSEAVTYTITSKVPSLLDEHFSYYSVIDQHSASLTEVTVKSVQVGGEAFGLNADYKVDETQKNFRAVNFTKDGLLKLEGKKNENIVVTLSAKVANVPAGDKAQNTEGLISNTAFVAVQTSPTEPGGDPDTPVTPNPGGSPTPKEPNDPTPKPSNVAKTTWGDVKIRKYDAASQATGLQGAVFEVLKPENDDACKAAAVAQEKNTATTGTAITEVTTGQNGEVTVPGLFIDKSDNGAPKTERCYVLREKTAPVGFVRPSLEKRTFAIIVKAGVSTDFDLTMPNTKVSVPALPLTGASGRVLLMVGGLALVLGSMGVVMVIRKRNVEA